MAMHDTKRHRRDPLYDLCNGASPMMISPMSMHRTPPRDLSFGKSMLAPAVTPQRGGCSQAAAIGIQWGTASSIGPRQRMEDFGTVSVGDGDAIFGVFDGHGGSYCAEFCQQRLHHIIRKQDCFPLDVTSAIIRAYGDADGVLLDELVRQDACGGTCALVAVVTHTHIYVGNVGDSRAVYSVEGEGVFELSQDHTPANVTEARRVGAAGGVVACGMVTLPDDNGELPITRALGDVRMKAIDPKDRLNPQMQVVSSMPELCVVPRSTSAQGFLVIASDGVWSCCKSDEAYAIVARQLNADGNPQRAADQLLAHVVMECHTSDNVFITVVLIAPFEPELTAARGTPSAPPPMPRTARPLSGAHTPPTNSPLVPARASLADASADVCGRGGARSARAAPPPTAIATFALVGES
ncbi:hypothetical protein KFE25_007201 [Diacronema lutheri]|uniref:PPM-type phosphatase domain-containing protein n=1 Tax=Diacronema lutheri TaxID=2081491 RepID=A0A8J5XQ53_DIALT|nr:hypothetical protein KFE25_007201 [Diacronema lutheri]